MDRKKDLQDAIDAVQVPGLIARSPDPKKEIDSAPKQKKRRVEKERDRKITSEEFFESGFHRFPFVKRLTVSVIALLHIEEHRKENELKADQERKSDQNGLWTRNQKTISEKFIDRQREPCRKSQEHEWNP